MTKAEKTDEEEETFKRKRAFIDILLKQYDFLRSEITQSIYLEHAAILALYTFLGVAVVYFAGMENSLNVWIKNTNPFLFLLTLILAQIVVNSFGSLFLWEQCRNRRACSFLRAIEYLINKEMRKIGIYWENFIVSSNIDAINRQYYKNRVLAAGVPVFLPNVLISLAILHMLIENSDPMYLLFSTISWMTTFLWGCMIVLKAFTPLSKDEIPDRGTVLEWLRKEERKLKKELDEDRRRRNWMKIYKFLDDNISVGLDDCI